MSHPLQMPTIRRLLAGAAITFATLTALVATSASASPGQTAIRLKDLDHPWGCWMSAGASGLSVNLHTKTGIHTVKTPSGNVKLICRFKIPKGAEPSKALKKSGFPCGIYLPGSSAFTSNTKAHSSPGGRARLECEINPSALKP